MFSTRHIGKMQWANYIGGGLSGVLAILEIMDLIHIGLWVFLPVAIPAAIAIVGGLLLWLVFRNQSM